MHTRICSLLIIVLCFGGLASCKTVHNAPRVDQQTVSQEGSVVFVRPTTHPVIGYRTISDYVEVTYERFVRNEAGLPKIEIGFRNRGGHRFYDRKGLDFQIAVKTSFYDAPLAKDGGAMGSPAYETNWQTLTLLRGDTYHYKSLCPKTNASYYQVIVSELQK